ncbi:MAG: PRD domain-containing protein [Paraclostridium sp.]
MYSILKSFNNNVILCIEDNSNKEYILVGKGIGFGLKANDKFSSIEKVEKKFVVDEDKQGNLEELYNNINPSYIGVVTEALSNINSNIEWDLNQKSHMAILDHIVFAIERYYENIFLENQFKLELKALYEYEWKIAIEIVDFINKTLEINLTEDEVAFITMHINGILNNTQTIDGSKQAIIIKEAMDFLEKELNIHIHKDSIYYNRLIIHLRLAINRVVKGISEKNMLIEHIKEKLKKSYSISNMLSYYLSDNYEINLTDDEIGFIALHIDRLLTQTNQK